MYLPACDVTTDDMLRSRESILSAILIPPTCESPTTALLGSSHLNTNSSSEPVRQAEQVRVMADPTGTVLTCGVSDTDNVAGARVGVAKSKADMDIVVDVSFTEEGDGVAITEALFDDDVSLSNK